MPEVFNDRGQDADENNENDDFIEILLNEFDLAEVEAGGRHAHDKQKTGGRKLYLYAAKDRRCGKKSDASAAVRPPAS